MAILFDDIVFGPVKSRRFGVSLGINLLPTTYKYCTFNCIYCECGWTNDQDSEKIKLSSRKEIRERMDEKFAELLEKGIIPDNITYAGNGEPTIHPEFSGVIDDTIEMRDKYFPNAQITVLSNATLLHKPEIYKALQKIENNVLKLDAGFEETYQLVNKPMGNLDMQSIIDKLKSFNGNLIVQSLFLRGKHEGRIVDNSTPAELEAWLGYIKEIQPKSVMIYSIERDTPEQDLEKLSNEELNHIAKLVNDAGIETDVY
ncbi:MAG: radical SAM protein [Bacteroidales bacterium]|nr:radical SAM protein [Bacteroidales bacterium]